MALHTLTTAEAEDRLEWLTDTAGWEIGNLLENEDVPDTSVIEPFLLGERTIDKLRELSRVAATVAKHYEDANAVYAATHEGATSA